MISLTAGRVLRGRYATVTEVSAAGAASVWVSSALHWTKRADGLGTVTPARSSNGPAQSLHESSGSAVLPDRVNSRTAPVDSHRIRPQVETLLVSRTGET